MNLHVLRVGSRIETLAGEPVAVVDQRNPLAEGRSEFVPRGPMAVVMWSGWLEGDGQSAVATWGPVGRQAFEAWCTSLKPVLTRTGGRIWIRSRADHVVSDTPSCADFLTRLAGGGLGLLLDPVGMLTPSMLPRAEEHLERTLSALSNRPGIAGVVLTNVRRSGESTVEPVPVHEGLLAGSMLARVVRERLPEQVPLILLDRGLAEQMQLLDAR